MGDNDEENRRGRNRNQTDHYIRCSKDQIAPEIYNEESTTVDEMDRHKLIKVADKWEVEEATAAEPTRKQRKELNEICLT